MMKIIGEAQNTDLYKEITVIETGRDNSQKETTEILVTEHPMDVYVNGNLWMRLTCTPTYLTELVLGRLQSENVIRSVEEVDTIQICEHGKRIYVALHGEAEKDTGDLQPVVPIKWEMSWIWELVDLFHRDMPLHQKTHAAHGCYLMVDGEVVFQCEDIGRHHAFDKAVGYALRYGYGLEKAVVYITGRVPSDMVVKAIRSRIPVIVSKEAPTFEAVELAQTYHLTLIGCTKKEKAKMYKLF